MKILYSIQGTGNGHISRAVSLFPYLEKIGQVDFLISGNNFNLKAPFEIKYKCKGISFSLNKTGGISILNTIKNIGATSFLKEVYGLPLFKYDLVINDFEPVSALCAKNKGIPNVSLSHQAAYLSKKTPKFEPIDVMGQWILQHYATCTDFVGIHFKEYDANIYTPVIREDIRNAVCSNAGHITVYLPAYHYQKLCKHFSKNTDTEFHIFDKSVEYFRQDRNIHLFPASAKLFQESFIHCNGIITGGGFETPAEAIFLGKKLLMIPIRGQYEQLCNAFTASLLGVTTRDRIDNNFIEFVEHWISNAKNIHIPYENKINQMLQDAIQRACSQLHDFQLA